MSATNIACLIATLLILVIRFATANNLRFAAAVLRMAFGQC